jgi:hypothetical protein
MSKRRGEDKDKEPTTSKPCHIGHFGWYTLSRGPAASGTNTDPGSRGPGPSSCRARALHCQPERARGAAAGRAGGRAGRGIRVPARTSRPPAARACRWVAAPAWATPRQLPVHRDGHFDSDDGTASGLPCQCHSGSLAASGWALKLHAAVLARCRLSEAPGSPPRRSGTRADLPVPDGAASGRTAGRLAARPSPSEARRSRSPARAPKLRMRACARACVRARACARACVRM